MREWWTAWRFRRWLKRTGRYQRTVVQDCGAMAWSEQAIARLSSTWVERFLVRQHIRRQVFHGVMAVSLLVTAVLLALSMTRFLDYTPVAERPQSVVRVNPWKAYCEETPWSKGCTPSKPTMRKR